VDLLRELGELAFASRLRRLSERLMQGAQRVYRASSLTFEPRWFPVVFLLARQSPLSVTEIAGELGMTHPAISQIVSILSRRRLVRSVPDPRDRRKRRLELSVRGQRLAEESQALWEAIRGATAELIAEADARALEVLGRLEAALDREDLFDRVQRHLARLEG